MADTVNGVAGVADAAAAAAQEKTKYVRNEVAASSKEMTITDFYKLLAAQLKYQDSDNPMDTSEMMAQMVQTQMITAINNMNNMNTSTYAASMIGKQVTVQEQDETGKPLDKYTTGTVNGVVLGSDAKIFVDGRSYSLSQLK